MATKRVCIQAGHKNRTSGATGAGGERDWNSAVVPKIAKILRESGIEVYETDAFADTDAKVVSTDWDLFLSVHYDADIYNDRGGFVDFPDPSVDKVTEESQRIAGYVNKFFARIGIPSKPNRSNKNTKFYYMWRALSAKTPCVLIECGVGARKPEDHNTLFNRIDEVAQIIAEEVANAFEIMPVTKPFNFDHTKQMPNSAWELLGYGARAGIKREWALDTIGQEFELLFLSNKDLVEKIESFEQAEETITALNKVVEEQAGDILKLQTAMVKLNSLKENYKDEADRYKKMIDAKLEQLDLSLLVTAIFKKLGFKK